MDVSDAAPGCTAVVVSKEGKVNCSVSFSGNLAPVMTWTDETGAVLPSTPVAGRTLVESRFSVLLVDKARAITVTTHFSKPTVESSDLVNSATNVARYNNAWSTRLILAITGKYF